jgi:acyl-CoA thioesterase-1
MHQSRRVSTAFLVALCAVTAACGGYLVGCDFGVGKSKTQDASGVAVAPPPPPASVDPSAASDRPRIVILGDSLTAGYGLPETNKSFPSVLQSKLDAQGYRFEVVNAGVSGDTSAGGLRRLDWALQGNVRVLVVALGGNDGLRGLSVQEMKQNIATIISEARKRKVVVVLAGMEAPPNYGQEYSTAFRQVYRDIARQEHVAFIPFLLDKVAGQSALNQGDGIHPNEQGARIVADTVWSVLRPVLDQMAAAS